MITDDRDDEGRRVTRQSLRSDVNQLYTFAKLRGLAIVNPCDLIRCEH